MPAYRLYCVDGAGKILSADWIEAADDADAVEAARQASEGARCEIWQRQRLVARLDPQDPNGDRR